RCAGPLPSAGHLPTYVVTVVAGHSVGELAAACVAGVLTPEAAVALAAVRGREMAAACTLERTGMSAVLGGDQDEVLEAIEAAGLHPANRNGAGQIVAAGALSSLEKLAGEPPAGARVKALKVAGAFHTPRPRPAPGGPAPRPPGGPARPRRRRSCCPPATVPRLTTGRPCCSG